MTEKERIEKWVSENSNEFLPHTKNIFVELIVFYKYKFRGISDVSDETIDEIGKQFLKINKSISKFIHGNHSEYDYKEFSNFMDKYCGLSYKLDRIYVQYVNYYFLYRVGQVSRIRLIFAIIFLKSSKFVQTRFDLENTNYELSQGIENPTELRRRFERLDQKITQDRIYPSLWNCLDHINYHKTKYKPYAVADRLGFNYE